MKHIYNISALFLALILANPAQAQFRVMESSVSDGATGVGVQDTLWLKFSEPVNTDTVISIRPEYSFGRLYSFPHDSILAGNVIVNVQDSIIGYPLDLSPGSQYTLYFTEAYSAVDNESMVPFTLRLSTGNFIAQGSVSGALSVPETADDEGVFVFLIPANQYTQEMYLQPLYYAMNGVFVEAGTAEFIIPNVRNGSYFVYALSDRKPESRSAVLESRPIGLYDVDENSIADKVDVLLGANVEDVNIELNTFSFDATSTEIFRERADSLAALWSEGARLINVSALKQINTAGDSEVWMWVYFNDRQRSGFALYTSGSQLLFASRVRPDYTFFRSIPDGWVGSDSAMSVAAQSASEFLESQDNVIAFASLVGGMNDGLLLEAPVWLVTFGSPTGFVQVMIDAMSGEEFDFSGITASEAVAEIEEEVGVWASDAYLTGLASAGESDTGSFALWQVQYYSPSLSAFNNFTVSGTGNPLNFVRPDSSGRTPIAVEGSWLDSGAILDSMKLDPAYPNASDINRVALGLTPIKTLFPADTFMAWQVFVGTQGRGQHRNNFYRVVDAETAQPYVQPSGTAKEWIATASNSAQSWASDAELMRIQSTRGLSVDESGESWAWSFTYKSASNSDSLLYVLTAVDDSREQYISVPDTISEQLPVLPELSTLIDSDEALTIAVTREGISAAPNPDMEFRGATMSLDQIRVKEDSSLSVWSIFTPVAGADRIGRSRVLIDASTGEILRQNVKTTDRTPFEVAKAEAREWSPDARLHYASADSVDEEGLVAIWNFIFWSRSKSMAFKVEVSGGTDIIFAEETMSLPDNFNPQRPLRAWIESARALARANEEVGDALRAANRLRNVRIALLAESDTAGTTSKLMTQNEPEDEGIWLVTYETTDGADEQILVGADDQATSTEDVMLPGAITLDQNYPNPFNPSTSIRYSLPAASEVRIEVFNMLGQRVMLLDSGLKSAGSHMVNVDASSMASGMYLYRLSAAGTVITKKMMLIK